MADTPKTYKVALNAVSEAQARYREAVAKRDEAEMALAVADREVREASEEIGQARDAMQLRIDADLAAAAEKVDDKASA